MSDRRWDDKSVPAHARTLSHRSVFRTLDEDLKGLNQKCGVRVFYVFE